MSSGPRDSCVYYTRTLLDRKSSLARCSYRLARTHTSLASSSECLPRVYPSLRQSFLVQPQVAAASVLVHQGRNATSYSPVV